MPTSKRSRGHKRPKQRHAAASTATAVAVAATVGAGSRIISPVDKAAAAAVQSVVAPALLNGWSARSAEQQASVEASARIVESSVAKTTPGVELRNGWPARSAEEEASVAETAPVVETRNGWSAHSEDEDASSVESSVAKTAPIVVSHNGWSAHSAEEEDSVEVSAHIVESPVAKTVPIVESSGSRNALIIESTTVLSDSAPNNRNTPKEPSPALLNGASDETEESFPAISPLETSIDSSDSAFDACKSPREASPILQNGVSVDLSEGASDVHKPPEKGSPVLQNGVSDIEDSSAAGPVTSELSSESSDASSGSASVEPRITAEGTSPAVDARTAPFDESLAASQESIVEETTPSQTIPPAIISSPDDPSLTFSDGESADQQETSVSVFDTKLSGCLPSGIPSSVLGPSLEIPPVVTSSLTSVGALVTTDSSIVPTACFIDETNYPHTDAPLTAEDSAFADSSPSSAVTYLTAKDRSPTSVASSPGLDQVPASRSSSIGSIPDLCEGDPDTPVVTSSCFTFSEASSIDLSLDACVDSSIDIADDSDSPIVWTAYVSGVLSVVSPAYSSALGLAEEPIITGSYIVSSTDYRRFSSDYLSEYFDYERSFTPLISAEQLSRHSPSRFSRSAEVPLYDSFSVNQTDVCHPLVVISSGGPTITSLRRDSPSGLAMSAAGASSQSGSSVDRPVKVATPTSSATKRTDGSDTASSSRATSSATAAAADAQTAAGDAKKSKQRSGRRRHQKAEGGAAPVQLWIYTHPKEDAKKPPTAGGAARRRPPPVRGNPDAGRSEAATEPLEGGPRPDDERLDGAEEGLSPKGPLRLQRCARLGRYLAAARPLRAGELLLQEPAALLGPRADATAPSCLRCLRALPRPPPICAECCAAPLCHGCRHADAPLGAAECAWLRGRAGPPPDLSRPRAVLMVRALLLRRAADARWPRVERLEAHEDARRGSDAWSDTHAHVVQPLRAAGMLAPDEDEELLQRVAGVLDVNTFEVRGAGAAALAAAGATPGAGPVAAESARALFPGAALLAHDCLPSAHVAVDERLVMHVRAARDLPEGAPVTLCYTSPLQATAERREHLLEGKYFLCECGRCRDPTESGTRLGGVVCPRCRRGDLLPPATGDGWWKCAGWEGWSGCGHRAPPQLAQTTHAHARDLVEAAATAGDERAMETLLATLRRSLPDASAPALALRQALMASYRSRLQSEARPPAALLQRQAALARELLGAVGALAPGDPRLAAVARYELHGALVALAQRARAAGGGAAELTRALRDAEKELAAAAAALLLEPPASPEGRLARAAVAQLRELREDILHADSLAADEAAAKEEALRRRQRRGQRGGGGGGGGGSSASNEKDDNNNRSTSSSAPTDHEDGAPGAQTKKKHRRGGKRSQKQPTVPNGHAQQVAPNGHAQ